MTIFSYNNLKLFYMKSKTKTQKKFDNDLCDDKMTFQDCELAILRNAVDKAEENTSTKLASSELVKEMIRLLEQFLIRKKCVCYGGTAINNILHKHAQFYDREIEIPDYDFYTPNALEDAKELADIYHKNGFYYTEAKSGIHYGTFKVYVNFIPIADITYLHPTIFNSMSKEAIQVAGILYAPANFLRMNMYLELSRPLGDVSRWEKVLKRLNLLDEHWPLKTYNCDKVDFQRPLDSYENDSEKLYLTIRDILANQGVMFLGGYATRLFAKDNKSNASIIKKIPDFEVLSDDAETVSTIIIERLKDLGYKNAKITKYEAVDEVIPTHYQIHIKNETLCFIYETIACHSYNEVTFNSMKIKIATIETMMTFYIAFYYSDRPYHDKQRILCMAEYLFNVIRENRLKQKGLLKRFSLDCYGKQHTIEEIREEKIKKFNELKGNRKSKEFDRWFLKYTLHESKGLENSLDKNKPKRKKTSKKQKTRKQKPNVLKKIGNLFK